jgi:glycerate dehydrogenase
VELAGLTLGIVGFGHIGRAVAEIGHAFGLKILVHTPSPKAAPAYVHFADLDTVFSQSDILTLHCPLTAQTEKLINAPRLARMKPTAFMINTSRGGLVDDPALAEALNRERLAGAGLDVLSIEPPPPDHPLLTARNCVITPHNAWGTRAARERLLHVAVQNIRAFLSGNPQNVVN